MVDIYESDKVVKTKKGWQVVTNKGDYPEYIDLQEFYKYYPENTKGVKLALLRDLAYEIQDVDALKIIKEKLQEVSEEY